MHLYTALVAAPMCFTKVPGTQIDEDNIEDTEDKVEDEQEIRESKHISWCGGGEIKTNRQGRVVDNLPNLRISDKGLAYSV